MRTVRHNFTIEELNQKQFEIGALKGALVYLSMWAFDAYPQVDLYLELNGIMAKYTHDPPAGIYVIMALYDKDKHTFSFHS